MPSTNGGLRQIYCANIFFFNYYITTWLGCVDFEYYRFNDFVNQVFLFMPWRLFFTGILRKFLPSNMYKIGWWRSPSYPHSMGLISCQVVVFNLHFHQNIKWVKKNEQSGMHSLHFRTSNGCCGAPFRPLLFPLQLPSRYSNCGFLKWFQKKYHRASWLSRFNEAFMQNIHIPTIYTILL